MSVSEVFNMFFHNQVLININESVTSLHLKTYTPVFFRNPVSGTVSKTLIKIHVHFLIAPFFSMLQSNGDISFLQL